MQGSLFFDGVDFDFERDSVRLTKQALRIWDVMKDSKWHTLSEIEELTGAPQASASACLRDFRKKRMGSHTVQREYVANGLYRYRLIPNDKTIIEEIRE